MKEKITLEHIRSKKEQQQKLTMITAYDYPSARLADQAGVELILVGDSLGMVVLGYESTVQVTMEEMIHHTKAVVRGTTRAFVLADMPFMSFQPTPEEAVRNAGRLFKEAGCDGVKLEGGQSVAAQVKAIVRAGIPVCAHIGLTPQTATQLSGYKVQGRDAQSADQLLQDAQALQQAGASLLVLECVPHELAQAISEKISIPTIGIGAGVDCDGQVLVFHDVLGLFDRFQPKFVKKYADLGPAIVQALKAYCQEVESGSFPTEQHSFKMSKQAREELNI